MSRKAIITLFLFWCTVATAQYKNPFFYTISVENGLPYMDVQASIQDRFGYIWLGTENGLIRYDGYSARSYTMVDAQDEPVRFYLSISDLYEDSRGTLWAVLTFRGYYYYDRERDTFIKASKTIADTSKIFTDADNIVKYVHNDAKDVEWVIDNTQNHFTLGMMDLRHLRVDTFAAGSKGRHHIPSWRTIDIAADAKGNTWLVTDSLLSLYDSLSMTFVPWLVLPDHNKSADIKCVQIDGSKPDVVWLAIKNSNSANEKVIQANTKNKKQTYYGSNAGLPNDECESIVTDQQKRTWFIFSNSISSFDDGSGRFINYPLTNPGKAGNNRLAITRLTADHQGNLWLGGGFRGLLWLNTKTGTTSWHTHTDEQGSLPDFSSTIKLYTDKSGIVWADLYPVGTIRLEPKKSFFNATTIEPPYGPNEKKVAGDFVYLKGRYNDTTFFVARNNKLYVWNYKRNQYKPVDFINALNAQEIVAVYQDKEGLLWVSTSNKGLYSHDPVSGRIRNYRHSPTDEATLPAEKVSTITEDKDKNMWLGTWGSGLACLDKRTGKVKRLPFVPNDGTITNIKDVLSDGMVTTLLYDSDGVLWVGTLNGGINRLNISTGIFTSFHDFKSGLDAIRSIYEDSRKRLWLGTNMSGVLLLDKITGSFEQYAVRNGLANNWVKGIREDKKGYIWAATAQGLSRLDPDGKSIINYTRDNGLPTVNTTAIYSGVDGKLFVGVKNGLLEFDPCNMETNAAPPAVVIESISYHKAGSKKNSDTGIYTYNNDHLTLSHNENNVTLHYIALHYANSALNQYARKLEGFDKDWIVAGTDRSVTYNNLSPGTYTFKVRAANSDGVWNEKGASFIFTIAPPWWRTWWAIGIFILAAVCAVYALIKWRTAALTRETERLENVVSERTAEVVNEKRKSEELLLNIIPSEIAEELKKSGTSDARHYQSVSVMFTDFVNFTNASAQMSPQELIDELHACFTRFDEITQRYNVEKIKTIGDAYLAVCGLPTADPKHAENIVHAAREINSFMENRISEMGSQHTFRVRIGIHSGSVVAGVVGVKKFAFDIWGDTVNTAARMEQHCEPGKINISQTTYELVKGRFTCQYRGELEVKGKGTMKMYFVS